ncbi:MAG: alpha/beta fold hydrolase [Actinomycetes bacterium]
MPVVTVDGEDLEYLGSGSGVPVTVFAHGLSGSIAETRPLGSGVDGTRVFFHFRGHGDSAAPPGPWSYDDVGGELLAIADHFGATRAVGASMGAGAICNVLAKDPRRFERAVLFLPAVLDTIPADAPVHRLTALADAIDDGDVDGLTRLLVEDQPPPVRAMPAVHEYMRLRAEGLVGSAISQAVRSIPLSVPVPDRSMLAAVEVPVLVVAQEGDPVHLVSIARELTDVLPNATLHVFPEDGGIWLARDELRQVIATFLNAS